jgi:hypothetical protein
MVPDGAHRDVEELGHFDRRPREAMHQHHRSALPGRQSGHCLRKGRFDDRIAVMRDIRKKDPAGFSEAGVLTYSVEIAGWVLHVADPFPMLPAVGERFGRCFSTPLGSEMGY